MHRDWIRFIENESKVNQLAFWRFWNESDDDESDDDTEGGNNLLGAVLDIRTSESGIVDEDSGFGLTVNCGIVDVEPPSTIRIGDRFSMSSTC